jgi:glyoxylase-like metal-dependent hydrolase (beta-lactamase superfamily II)
MAAMAAYVRGMIKVAVCPVTPFQQNCSLVWCEETRQGALVDPGGDLARLKDAVAQTGMTVAKVMLTHGHVDHASAAGAIAEAYGVQIEGPHEGDRYLIEGLPDSNRKYGFAVPEPFLPHRWLQDGDTVELGKLTFDVVHCPGHTPGHVVFVNKHEKARIAFVGDVLFRGSVGRTDFPKGDQAQLFHSIRKKLFPLGDDIGFVPGHGQTSTFGWERKTNPFVCDMLFEDET